MKILLVHLSNDWVYNTATTIASIRKDEPLGIEYLASGLMDHDVSLLDLNVTNFTENEFEEYIESLSPDLVGITISTPLVLEAKKLTRCVKKIVPDSLLVIGGPHPSALPVDSLNFIGADISVLGEGEETIKELAEGLPFEKINGIAYRTEKKIKLNDPRDPIQNLDNIPFPERTILPRENYLQYPFEAKDNKMKVAGSIITSRSCPNKCIFCASKSVFGNKLRLRSPENVIDEIEELVNVHKVRNFIFVDDCFTVDQKRTMLICKGIIERDLDIKWKVDTRVNKISKELLITMKKAGCRLIVYGVEAGSQRILNVIKKATTINMIKNAFKLTNEVGIHTQSNFMLGHPTETEDEIWQSINLAKELNPSKTGFYLVMPLPGSELYRMAKEQGLIIEDFSEFRWYGKNVANLSEVSPKRLKELQELAYREVPKPAGSNINS